jgi:hypothetical protein
MYRYRIPATVVARKPTTLCFEVGESRHQPELDAYLGGRRPEQSRE